MAQDVRITKETREAATEVNALPLFETVLLGTLISPEGPKAVLRNGYGGVQTVGVGSQINGGEVTAIRDGALFISRGGRGLKLTMPGH